MAELGPARDLDDLEPVVVSMTLEELMGGEPPSDDRELAVDPGNLYGAVLAGLSINTYGELRSLSDEQAKILDTAQKITEAGREIVDTSDNGFVYMHTYWLGTRGYGASSFFIFEIEDRVAGKSAWKGLSVHTEGYEKDLNDLFTEENHYDIDAMYDRLTDLNDPVQLTGFMATERRNIDELARRGY